MATSLKHVAIFALINAFITITTVSSQCCTMDGVSCRWDYVADSWQYAPGKIPDTSVSYYPNFLPTAPSIYYLWLQDQSGTMSSENTFTVTSPGTTFTFDYYFHTPDPDIGDYLHVILKIGLTNNVIASITEKEDYWRQFVVTCDSSVNYCCGSYSDIPCTGKIEIAATFVVTPNQGLTAITNFGENCGPVTTNTARPTTTPIAAPTTTPFILPTTTQFIPPTTTPFIPPTTTPDIPPTTTPFITPYTIPPPHPDPDGCCDFQYDVCSFSISYPYWYWSATKTQTPPTSYIPPYDGNYFWTDQSGAIATTGVQTISSALHTFSITYYLDNANILVNFFEISPYSQKIPLPNLTPTLITSGLWYHQSFQTNFCSTYPCQGYFTIEPLPLSSPFVVAIDDVDYDGRCHGSIPCCYFDDVFICDFIYPTSTSYFWQWSGPLYANYPTVIPTIPNPGSDFIYFEVTTNTSVVASVPLSSGLITIPQNVIFQGKFFARTPFGYAGVEALQLDFIESTTLTVTTMEFVKDTSNGWLVADFSCYSIHGDCCQGMPICSGYLEFTATVQADGGPLIYGIDAFGVKAICPIPNPSMTHNITSIPLHIKGF